MDETVRKSRNMVSAAVNSRGLHMTFPPFCRVVPIAHCKKKSGDQPAPSPRILCKACYRALGSGFSG